MSQAHVHLNTFLDCASHNTNKTFENEVIWCPFIDFLHLSVFLLLGIYQRFPNGELVGPVLSERNFRCSFDELLRATVTKAE
jgi:hypothetical protein